MQIVSLIAGPASPGIEPALAEQLAGSWHGAAPVWLAPGLACEFAVAAAPAEFSERRRELLGCGIDLNILPAAGRRKQLLVADMDSTIIEQECIDELAAEAGVGDLVARITWRAMNGEIDFSDALHERVALLAGLPVQVADEVWQNRITCTPGAAVLVATMRAGGARAILISGGFTEFTGRVARRLGFDEHYANRLLAADGKLTGKLGEPLLGRPAKTRILGSVLGRLGLTAADAIAVGDGSNDIEMLGMAGLGIAFRARPAVERATAIRIRHGDLAALLYLQGYSRREFVAGNLVAPPM